MSAVLVVLLLFLSPSASSATSNGIIVQRDEARQIAWYTYRKLPAVNTHSGSAHFSLRGLARGLDGFTWRVYPTIRQAIKTGEKELLLTVQVDGPLNLFKSDLLFTIDGDMTTLPAVEWNSRNSLGHATSKAVLPHNQALIERIARGKKVYISVLDQGDQLVAELSPAQIEVFKGILERYRALP